jgi:SAM-dependent methyltransferase
VLDLAAGHGRHTAVLLAAGCRVLAVDRDVATLRARFGADPRCEINELDLEDGRPWPLGGGFAAIIVTNYLHRPLLPAMPGALAADGLLLYETFMTGNERVGRPTNPDFLLRPGELLAAFLDRLQVVAFEQGFVTMPRAAAIQRIAAVKSALPGALPL